MNSARRPFAAMTGLKLAGWTEGQMDATHGTMELLPKAWGII